MKRNNIAGARANRAEFKHPKQGREATMTDHSNTNGTGISRRRFLGTASAASVTIAGVSIAGMPGPANAQTVGALVYAVNSINGNFEPTVWHGFGDSVITMDSLARGLTRADFATATIEPAVAESWEVSEDGTAWTFRVREGVKMHDGRTATAHDVMRTFNRILDPEDPTRPEGSGAIDNLGGDNLLGIEQVDEMTVRFNLRAPDQAFPARLSRPDMVIISADALEKYGADVGKNLVSCGPFRLADVKPGESAIVEAFPDFFGGAPTVGRVVFQVLPDPLALTSAMLSGEVQCSNFVPHSNLDRLGQSGRVQVFEPDPYINLFLAMNAKTPALSDIRVRRAINLAIDRDAVIAEAFLGKARRPAYFSTEVMMGYSPDHLRYSERNMEEAQRLLAEAGAEGTILRMHSQNTLFWPAVGQVVERNLRELGLEIETRYVESGSFFGTMFDAEAHDLGLWQRSSFMPDPDGKFSPLFFSGTLSADNTTAHTDLPIQPEMEDRILAALSEPDREKRDVLYVELNAFIAENLMVHAMLANIYTPVAAAQGISGLNVNGMGTYRVFLEDVKPG